jgi:mediator of RNA polymerase II transcription subunit 5
MISYLNMRYKGDVQTLCTALVTASFDMLANGMYRNEDAQTMFVFRSFLVNKLPTLLVILSQALPAPVTTELCIQQAFGQLDPNAFPSFDLSSGINNLSEVRQDFLFACALHQLLPVASIERLLGETPMSSLPASGKYTKDQLVAQCSTNTDKIQELMNGLESMDGNVGAVALAVVDVS